MDKINFNRMNEEEKKEFRKQSSKVANDLQIQLKSLTELEDKLLANATHKKHNFKAGELVYVYGNVFDHPSRTPKTSEKYMAIISNVGSELCNVYYLLMTVATKSKYYWLKNVSQLKKVEDEDNECRNFCLGDLVYLNEDCNKIPVFIAENQSTNDTIKIAYLPFNIWNKGFCIKPLSKLKHLTKEEFVKEAEKLGLIE